MSPALFFYDGTTTMSTLTTKTNAAILANTVKRKREGTGDGVAELSHMIDELANSSLTVEEISDAYTDMMVNN